MKYLALDIGNVCIAIRPERLFAALVVSGPEALPAELFGMVDLLERGRLSEEAFSARFRELTGDGRSGDELRAAFVSIIGEPIPGMAEKLERLIDAGVQPVFFSDTSALHLAEVRRKFPAARRIPDGVYSFEVGAKKPEPAMFRAFEERFGTPAAYWDDRPELIAAAPPEWNARLFRSAEDAVL